MVRKTFALGMVLLLLAGVLSAQDKTVKLTGYVIDNACASGAHGDAAKTAEKAKGHTVSCALMPGCEKSGYSLISGDKMYKFDDAGNKSVVETLKSTKSKQGLMVMAEGTVEGDTLRVTKLAEAAGDKSGR